MSRSNNSPTYSEDITQGRPPISNYVFEDDDIDLDDDSDDESSTSDENQLPDLQLLAAKNSILNVKMLYEMSKICPHPTPSSHNKKVQYEDEIYKRITNFNLNLDQNITLGGGATNQTIESLLPRDISFEANNNLDLVGFYKELMYSKFEPEPVDNVTDVDKNAIHNKNLEFEPDGNIFSYQDT